MGMDVVAMIIGVSRLDFKNTWNAIWVCVVGLITYWLVYIIFYFAYGLQACMVVLHTRCVARWKPLLPI
jgi:ABC-type uncharacterized transport system permease subunit